MIVIIFVTLHKKFMKYNEKKIITRYEDGEHANSIAKSLGTYNTTIRRILLRNNIKLRGCHEAQRTVHHNPFLKPQSDYWLGLLATDGCNTNGALVLELKENDEYILEEYVKHIGTPINITKTYSKKFDSYQSRVAFRNREVIEFMNSIGIVPRKSLTLDLKYPISWDFFRGVVDGDGHIHTTRDKRRVSICIGLGARKFRDQLSEFLTANDIAHMCNDRTLYFVEVHRKEAILKCYNNMYKEGVPFLKRKYEKFGYAFEKSRVLDLAKTGKVPSTNPVLASS